MSFSNLNDLAIAVSANEQFQHEIKGKRVKKELHNLEEYHNERLTFKRYQISPAGISFYFEYRLFDFEILIDYEYPFNRPKVFYIHESSAWSNCQDLLDTILEGSSWGPSMLISSILDKINDLASRIAKEADSLKAVYHLNDFYEETLLTRYRVNLYNVEEYEWKYMIKSTTRKVLGLTKETLLKFVPEGGKLKLEASLKIKELREANAAINGGKFKLDIVSNSEDSKSKYYFGGEEADIEQILYFMNPIQVTERKLTKLDKQIHTPSETQDLIQKYSQLIEYYSLRDAEKTKHYVSEVQELIKRSYAEHSLSEPKEEIKT